jgi:curved DNA-binding protein CbpA
MDMKEELRKATRHPVEGEVGIAWRDNNGLLRFSSVRGVDLSENGVGVESLEPLEADSYVQVHAEHLGFSWTAHVRYCRRRGSKYIIGLEFCRSRADTGQQESDGFVDYYELMQISATAEQDTISRVFRLLAARYHPDNVHTGDNEKFLLLKSAFDTLSDPVKRAVYDTEYSFRQKAPIPVFELKEFVVGIDAEVNRRLGVLCLLYNRRRADPDKPYLSLLEFEQMMRIPREHLVFTIWYLKEKRLLRTESNADFEITADGAEFVESSLPTNRLLQKLLHASEQSSDATPKPRASTKARPSERPDEDLDGVL